jgi:hypothetical protein
MQHMQFAAQMMAKFMVNVDFIPKAPDLETLLDERFIQAYAERVGEADTSVEDVAAFRAASGLDEPDTEVKQEPALSDMKGSSDVN